MSLADEKCQSPSSANQGGARPKVTGQRGQMQNGSEHNKDSTTVNGVKSDPSTTKERVKLENGFHNGTKTNILSSREITPNSQHVNGSYTGAKCSRSESMPSYPLLQWAFSGMSDMMQGGIYGNLFNPRRLTNRWECDAGRNHRTQKGNMCKSRSLHLNHSRDRNINPNQEEGQVNHISLYDETDEILALERWKNAGLALRRVLGKSGSTKGGKRVKEKVSPECQNVVDEIFEDVDEDTLKNVGSSSTCSTSELQDVISLTEIPEQRSESPHTGTGRLSERSSVLNSPQAGGFTVQDKIQSIRSSVGPSVGSAVFNSKGTREQGFFGLISVEPDNGPEEASVVTTGPVTCRNHQPDSLNEQNTAYSSFRGNDGAIAGNTMVNDFRNSFRDSIGSCVGNNERNSARESTTSVGDLGGITLVPRNGRSFGSSVGGGTKRPEPGQAIWGSQLYSPDISGQLDLSPDQPDQESSLFPWRHGASLLGACLFPQCIGMLRASRQVSRPEGKCNDRGEECNKDKHNCDNKTMELIDLNSSREDLDTNMDIVYQRDPMQTEISVSCPPSDTRLQDANMTRQEGEITLNLEPTNFQDYSHQPNHCGSSFHSEDSHGDTTRSSGYHGDKGGDSDASGYSSMCGGDNEIYFYEDSNRFDTVPRRVRRGEKSPSPGKKGLQREKKKKLIHARKTHKRKNSSSSSDVVDEGPDSQVTADVAESLPNMMEPCPSFITCSALDEYDQVHITPPRRSASIARHFLDRGRSRDRQTGGVDRGFRSRDIGGTDVSVLPAFDISPLSRLPSFLESLRTAAPCEIPDQDIPDLMATQGETTLNDHCDKGYNSSQDFPEVKDSENEKSDEVNGVDSHPCLDLEDAEGNSLLSPDSWIRLIDEIYQPIVCESDTGQESALSDTDPEVTDKKTPDFFRCVDVTDRSSDSGDADDEFECECDHCQLLRSLHPPTQLPQSTVNADTGEITPQEGQTTGHSNPWDSDWPIGDDRFDLNLDDLRPLEPFLLSLQDMPQDPVDLMFQNVITQMLAVHPELLGEQAPPPVSQSVIDSLPALIATMETRADDVTCPVCLCHFEVGDDMTRLPCQHRYHPLCIQAWLAKSGTCPVCRHSLHSQRNSTDLDEY